MRDGGGAGGREGAGGERGGGWGPGEQQNTYIYDNAVATAWEATTKAVSGNRI